MRTDIENVNIIKASGIKVPFEKQKLKQSLLRSGANSEQVDKIVEHLVSILTEGMSTTSIYQIAFELLKNMSHPVAARYNLKRAIMELGPSGFPFEQFVAELLKYRGYKTQVGVIVKAHCVNHEIDVIAEKDDLRFLVECKFHNLQGQMSDVKIPLYIQSRFLDVEMQWKQADGYAEKSLQGWVITNTRFSDDAMQYGKCMSLNLVSWDYPQNSGLKDWIDISGLHPVTCLTTLTSKEKQDLLNRKIVLCKSVLADQHLLESIGLKPPRLQRVLDECFALSGTISR